MKNLHAAYIRRLLGVFLLALSGIGLAGCPQHIEQLVDEALPPKNYKPVYTTSTIPLPKVLDQYKGWKNKADSMRAATVRNAGADSAAPDAATAMRFPLAMDIQSVDDSRYPDQIEMRAFVYDTSGHFVMGLAPPYFAGNGAWRDYWRRLTDSCGGHTTAIDSFEVTEVRETKREPYAIAFVLDHSGSMGDTRVQRLRQAVERTLKIIKPGDRISIIKFTDNVLIEVPLTGDTAVYRSFRVDAEQCGGGTAIYDGALAGIDEVNRAPKGYKRALIVFTDGIDGDSKATIDSLHRMARTANVNIYTVAYGMANTDVLQDIATFTGGRMYRIYTTKEFPYVFADIYRRFNNYYRITYHPPECAGVHTATASLFLPELRPEPLVADGHYDRSVFTPFDQTGQIVFVNIEFDFDKATIRPESMPKIQEIADAMNKYPRLTLEVRGHTDDRGSDDYNKRLSEDRAQSVADALVKMGISSKRLTVAGFGKSRPLVPNTTEENRKKNRRTEFVIVSK